MGLDKWQPVTNLEMAMLLIDLPAHLEKSDSYEDMDYQEQGRWGTSQREHLIAWFFSRTCEGGYPGYEVKSPWLEASKTYRYLNNPAAYIWLAEALGVPESQIDDAYKTGLVKKGENLRTQCAAIRDKLPWKVLEPLARKLIDEKRIRIRPGTFTTEV